MEILIVVAMLATIILTAILEALTHKYFERQRAAYPRLTAMVVSFAISATVVTLLVKVILWLFFTPA